MGGKGRKLALTGLKISNLNVQREPSGSRNSMIFLNIMHF